MLKWTYHSGNLLDGVEALCHITMPLKRATNETHRPTYGAVDLFVLLFCAE
jgi:hypothetical protein